MLDSISKYIFFNLLIIYVLFIYEFIYTWERFANVDLTVVLLQVQTGKQMYIISFIGSNMCLDESRVSVLNFFAVVMFFCICF